MAEFKEPHLNNVVVVDFERGPQKKVPPSYHEKALNEKKRHLFEQWVKQGIVSVVLDARTAGVKAPPAFLGQPELVLNFSYDFHVPDFNFNEAGVWATLSFDDGDHFCMVPWQSVMALHSVALKQGARWFADFASESSEDIDLSHEEVNSSHDIKNNIVTLDFGGKNNP